jgi:hypothetical protein
MKEKFPVPRPGDNDAHWTGWTYSLEFPFPLDKIRRDGFDVREITSERRKYWEIIKAVATVRQA